MPPLYCPPSVPGEHRANGFVRVRYQVMSAAPLDFKAEGNKLAELIKQYSIS